jgi:hypothetical protein
MQTLRPVMVAEHGFPFGRPSTAAAGLIAAVVLTSRSATRRRLVRAA